MTNKDPREAHLQTLAEVIYSSAISYKEQDIFKSISFDFEPTFAVDKNKVLYWDTQKITDREDIVRIIFNKLVEYTGGFPEYLEFIRVDDVTKMVMVVTKGLIDRIKDPNELINYGNLPLTYFNIWYKLKCGGNPWLIVKNHAHKFSHNELNLLDEDLIPIAIQPVKMTVIRRMIDDAIVVSPLAPYVLSSRGFDIFGKSIPDSKMWWVHRSVAKEYLQESDITRVLSVRVLKTLLNNAGLLQEPPKPDHRQLAQSSSLINIMTERTNEYLKQNLLWFNQNGDQGESNPHTPLTEPLKAGFDDNKGVTLDQRVSNIISADIDVSDAGNKIGTVRDLSDLGLFKK